jgi:nicotinamide-nucleotide amidase
MEDRVTAHAKKLMELCHEKGWFLACAESLTGGLLADAFVSIPGASTVFLGSAVTYYLGAKMKLLGVDEQMLKTVGAVDPRVAQQMAQGTQRLYAQARQEYEGLSSLPLVLGLSTTGVAGPESDGFQPVGRVYTGVCVPGHVPQSHAHMYAGDRDAIRRQAVLGAIDGGLAALGVSGNE